MLKDFLRGVLFISLPVFAGGVATCAGAVLILRAVTTYAPDPFEAHPFDPAEWAAADPKGRAAMARDAIRHLPAGLPEADIRALLGDDCTVRDTLQLNTLQLIGHGRNGTVRRYEYDLGSWSGVYFDDTFLWIHVGADGRVIKAEIGGR
jgi:hypothetical protein